MCSTKEKVFIWQLYTLYYNLMKIKKIKINLIIIQNLVWKNYVKLFMNFTNKSGTNIRPRVAGPWGMFSILRVLCSGAIIEDIDLYGRLHEQFHMMMLSEKTLK